MMAQQTPGVRPHPLKPRLRLTRAGLLWLGVALTALLIGVFKGINLLVLLASLVLVPIMFVAISRYAVTNNFRAALPGPVFQQLRSNLGAWIMIMVALVGVGLVAGLLAVCTFGIGAVLIIPFVFYLQLVQGHWLAQAYRLSVGNQSLPPSMV